MADTPHAGLSLHLPPEVLTPLIREAVSEAVVQLEADRSAVGGKLAYGEGEAARLPSLNQHQLRDERLRGRITASVGPGQKILYSRNDLLGYLARRRWMAKTA